MASTIAESAPRHEYPGLGLPLRHDERSGETYPMGAHGSCYGGKSDMVSVRELAMMMIMDQLTDKPDWHRKVFDEEVGQLITLSSLSTKFWTDFVRKQIVSKWRAEALAIPDVHFVKVAGEGRSQWAHNDENSKLEHIMDEDTFKSVSRDSLIIRQC